MMNVETVFVERKAIKNSLPAVCPFCSAETLVNALVTEPMCNHFDDYTLLKREEGILMEIDEPSDQVVALAAKFRKSGNMHERIEFRESGDLVQTAKGFELKVKGVTVKTLQPDDLMELFFGCDEDDEVDEE